MPRFQKLSDQMLTEALLPEHVNPIGHDEENDMFIRTRMKSDQPVNITFAELELMIKNAREFGIAEGENIVDAAYLRSRGFVPCAKQDRTLEFLKEMSDDNIEQWLCL